jgi:hypothetical protein
MSDVMEIPKRVVRSRISKDKERKKKGLRDFLIEWIGYPDKESYTWQPAEDFESFLDDYGLMLAQFRGKFSKTFDCSSLDKYKMQESDPEGSDDDESDETNIQRYIYSYLLYDI